MCDSSSHGTYPHVIITPSLTDLDSGSQCWWLWLRTKGPPWRRPFAASKLANGSTTSGVEGYYWALWHFVLENSKQSCVFVLTWSFLGEKRAYKFNLCLKLVQKDHSHFWVIQSGSKSHLNHSLEARDHTHRLCSMLCMYGIKDLPFPGKALFGVEGQTILTESKNFNSGGQEPYTLKHGYIHFIPFLLSWSHCSDQRAVSQEDSYSGYTIVSRRTEPGATAGAGASVFAYGWPTRSSSQNTNQRTKTLVKGRQNWTPKTLFKAQVLSTSLPQQN